MLTLDDITDAQRRVSAYVTRTQTVRSTTLSQRLGTNVYLKLELFQKTGSFKPRGAFNKMLSLEAEELAKGVVGFSGGNFAQGMAYAGQALGVDTLVLMPEATPDNYVDGTKAYGATVELTASIEAAMKGVEAHVAAGRTPMHPFDDPAMMAGNGTLGLELIEDVPQLTDVFVSVGGGGLMTGVVTAVKALKPAVRAWAVETQGADALSLSLAAGEPVHITPTSIAKTLGAPYAAAAAIELAKEAVEDVIVVSDAAAFASLRLLLERAKLLTEPAAACTLAAAETQSHRFGVDDHVVLVLCGGNVSFTDLVTFAASVGHTL